LIPKYIDLIRHDHVILQSYSIERSVDLSSVMKEGQISSRTLMSLNVICQVSINQRDGYPVRDNVWMTIKNLILHFLKLSESAVDLEKSGPDFGCCFETYVS